MRFAPLLKAARGAVASGARGAATSTPLPQDKIVLKGLVFHGYHGVLEEERRLGQKFVVDAELTTDLRLAGQSDDLQDTISYADVYRAIKAEVEGPPRRLVETVAERVAAAILAGNGGVRRVRVAVHKPHVAVEGVVQHLGVEITRMRRDADADADAQGSL